MILMFIMKKTLAKILENLYGLEIVYLEKIKTGFTNKNYYVSTNTNEKFIVRVSPLSRMKHLWLEIYVLNKLKGKIPLEVPEPFISKINTYNVRVGNNLVTVFKFIEGKAASSIISARNLEICRFSKNLGRVVAILHEELSRINIPNTSFTHQRLISSYYDLFKFYTVCSYYPHDAWRKELLKKMNIILKVLYKYIDYYDNLRRQMFIHTDIRMDNLIVRDKKIVGIIDFDDIMVGDEAFDLASILVEIYSDKKTISEKVLDIVNLDDFLVMLKEYLKQRKIIRKEEFIQRVVNFINLQILQVLSIVGRDIEFDEKERMNNVLWYLNLLELLDKEENLKKMRNFLLNNI